MKRLGALLLALLLVCSAACAMAEATPSEASCEHDWSRKDGVCTICGASCPGHSYDGAGSADQLTYSKYSTTEHSVTVTNYSLWTCAICGYTDMVQNGEPTTLYEDHTWKNGVCTICDEVCSHPDRGHTDEDGGTQKNTVSVDNLDGTHTRTFDVYHNYVCTICGDVEERYMGQGVEVEEHYWKADGTCASCGAQKPCEHVWSNGVCTICGFECSHPYPMLTPILENCWATPLPSVAEDAYTHTDYALCHNEYICECGVLYTPTDTTGYLDGQPHTWEDGVCTACGYVCQHPHSLLTYNPDKSWDTGLPSVAEDENTHTINYVNHDVFDCACGLEAEAPEYQVSLPGRPHTWEDGVCTECGYECLHAMIEMDGDPIRTDGEAEYVDANTHIQHYTTEQKMKCSVCGGSVESSFGSGKDSGVEHTYVDGVCACGAKEPAVPSDPDDTGDTGDDTGDTTGSTTTGSTTTGTTTGNTGYTAAVTTTAAAVEEEEDLLFAPAVPEPVTIENMVAAVAEAAASGKEVKIEIIGAQQVMTETEYTRLKTLPAQEQILVTLASIGLKDVVSAALETMSTVELSQDAQDLMETVSARLDAASEEERAQLEQTLAEYFPVREIEVDGVVCEYYVMELVIEVDGVATIQTYGFRLDENGEWIFVILS